MCAGNWRKKREKRCAEEAAEHRAPLGEKAPVRLRGAGAQVRLFRRLGQ